MKKSLTRILKSTGYNIFLHKNIIMDDFSTGQGGNVPCKRNEEV